MLENGYTLEQAKVKLAQDQADSVEYARKYQEAVDKLPTWARIAMTIQDTVGMVYGAKAAGVGLGSLGGKGLKPVVKGTTNIANDFIKNPHIIWGRTVNDIAKDFQSAGYVVNIRQSTRGSGQAVIVEVKNHPEISQIQYHLRRRTTWRKLLQSLNDYTRHYKSC